MSPDDVRATVIAAIAAVAPEVDPAGLDPDEEIWFGLDLDSMDQLRIMEQLAERTGVHIPEADYPRLQSIDDIVDYLVATTAGGGV